MCISDETAKVELLTSIPSDEPIGEYTTVTLTCLAALELEIENITIYSKDSAGVVSVHGTDTLNGLTTSVLLTKESDGEDFFCNVTALGSTQSIQSNTIRYDLLCKCSLLYLKCIEHVNFCK